MTGMVDRRISAAGSSPRTRRWRNWARTEEITPLLTLQPSSVAEVQDAVRLAAELGTTVKAVGAGHSFTGIAVAPGIQLEMSRLSGLLAADREARVVTLAAGTHLFEIPALLEPLGLAMANLGDIDKQTISGAVSTGTHGTGTAFGGIATQLLAVQLVVASGEILEISPASHPELWPAARLGLGALGVLTAITIQCVPAFALAAVERRESLQDTLDRFESRCDAEDHFEFYWFPHTDVALTKTNTRLPADAALAPINPLSRWVDDTVMANGLYRGMTALATTLPAVIPRFNRVAASVTGERRFTDRSTSVFTTSRTVRFREMEYAVDRAAVPAVLREIDALIERKRWNVSFPVEVRSAAADDLWLSTASGRLSGYIAVHKYWRETNYREYFAAVEEIFRAYEGRPHWGKLHTQNAESLARLYPHHGDFVAVRDRLDPARLFANDYLRRVLGE